MSEENTVTNETQTPENGTEAEGQPKPRRGRPPKVEKPEEPVVVPGRIVYYVTSSGRVRPAIIAGVVEESLLQVVVFNSTGGQYMDNVQLVSADEAEAGEAFFPNV